MPNDAAGPPEFAGIDGFLGTRGSIMLDLVVVAMVAVVPLLTYSIWQVRYRRRFQLHKTLQLMLGAALLAAVVLFELDMRINGWRHRAIPSPYWGTGSDWNWVVVALTVHLVFAVTAAVLWVIVIARALKNFPKPPAPGEHSASHILWARIAAAAMYGTAVTGWVFYWLAFVAT